MMMKQMMNGRTRKKMDTKKINILGTEYKIEVHKISEDNYLKEHRLAGYCGEEDKMIVIADMSEKEYFEMNEEGQKSFFKKTLRHELIHAFLNESGLSDNASRPDCSWAKYEEMVDWIAIQFPKILKTFEEAGAL